VTTLEDQRRFKIWAMAWNDGSASLFVECARCGWQWESEPDEEVTLADLDQRADEHTEVCR